MAGIAYCISPNLYEKLKKQGLLDSAEEETNESPTEKILENIPFALKGVAAFIIEKLKDSIDVLPDFDFNFESRHVPNSDIRDLLLKLVTQDPILYTLQGSNEFVNAVKSHVPSNKYKLPYSNDSSSEVTERDSLSPDNPNDSTTWLRFEDKFNLA